MSLDAYSLQIRNRRDTKLLSLDKFNNKDSILTVFSAFLESIKGKFFDSIADQKCISIEKIATNSNSIIGLCLIGEYGYGARLVDPKSGQTSYNMKKTEAPLEPFYFEFHIPPSTRKAMIICARHGQSGCKSMLTTFLREKFNAGYSEYIMDVLPLMPRQAIDALIARGKLSSVRFIQEIIPQDIADKFNGDQKSQEGELELVIRPKKTGLLKMQNLRDVLSLKKQIKDLVQLDNFEPENIKLEVEIDGRKKTIDFGNLGHVRASFDVTHEITAGNDGYPTFASMNKSSENLIATLLPSL
ncbi:hypothetical protein [Methylobacterium mesophilicum]